MSKLAEQLRENFNTAESRLFFNDLIKKIKISKEDFLSDDEVSALFLQSAVQIADEGIEKGTEVDYKDVIDLIDEFRLINKLPEEVLYYKNRIVLYLIYKAKFKEALSVAEPGTEEAISAEKFHIAFLLLNNQGTCYWRMGQNDIALKKYLHSIELSKKVELNENHFKPNLNAGLIFQSFGLMDQAYEYFMKALDISEKTNDEYGRAAVYGNLGVFYYDMGDTEKSKDYYLKSINIWEELDNLKGLPEIYNNISIYFSENEDYGKAREYITKSIGLARSLNQTAQVINAIESLSAIELRSGNEKEGEKLTREALELAEKNSFPFVEQQCYDNLAHLYKNDKEKALEYGLKSMEISEKMDDKRLIKASAGVLHEIYKFHCDFENALKYYKKMFEVNEKIKNEEYSNKIAGLQSNYEYREAKKESEFLKQKNSELSHLIAKLEKLNTEKTEFLSIAAHDLRNPLSTIIGFSKILLETLSEKDEHFYIIKDIKISADSMLELINNLLDIDKIEEGKYGFNITEFDLVSLIKEVISRFSLHAKLKNQGLKFEHKEKEIFCATDKNALSQILENLISNAIKFSPGNSNVYISLANEGGKITLCVCDEGPGFSSSEKEKIFSKFPHISNKPTSGESSTGLGLFIVKKLSESINADITFENNKEKGAAFTLTLPVRK